MHSLIPLLPSFLSHLSLSLSCNCQIRLRLISAFSCVKPSLYSIGGGLTENSASYIFPCWFTAAQMCLQHNCVATSTVRKHRKRQIWTKCLWRWYISTNITFLDIIVVLSLFKLSFCFSINTQRFENWILSPSSGRFYLKTETESRRYIAAVVMKDTVSGDIPSSSPLKVNRPKGVQCHKTRMVDKE
jgi:hypothetical protein